MVYFILIFFFRNNVYINVGYFQYVRYCCINVDSVIVQFYLGSFKLVKINSLDQKKIQDFCSNFLNCKKICFNIIYNLFKKGKKNMYFC